MTREQAVRLGHRPYARQGPNSDYNAQIYRDGAGHRVFEFVNSSSWAEGAGICLGSFTVPRSYDGARAVYLTLGEMREDIAANEAALEEEGILHASHGAARHGARV